ncbi:MAG: tetratricopeptide repeat protein [Rhodospirillaceae bacterium]|nr:tetratricopeptide repeat protein [Rhodospirillaceae bacterium]MBT5878092.1 tetratricopeptide repeat protein [Rhodospirillaceae bacterium]MBT6590173.1 tetratricopeptide repeat protein [Rhodospirillaceae bacterium]MBT7288639.1 tetratricopeptide repeat protein [Rhodospirillaceae bacterium]
MSRLDRSLYQAAESFEQRRDYATAVSYYRNLYRRNAADVEAVIGLSRGLRQLRQAREAQAIVLRALKGAPKDLQLRAELGKVQLALGEPLKAVDSLSRVDAEATTKRWDIKVALAIAYDSVGMYEQAERRYRQALDISPENAVIMNNFALSLAQSGKLPEALEIMERAASLPEATPRMRQNLAMLYAMKGDLASAEQYVRRDMPREIADQNMIYYRQLREGMAVSTNATPALAKVVKGEMVETPKPAEIVASEVPPKNLQAPQPVAKEIQVASEEPKAMAKVEPELKAAEEDVAVTVAVVEKSAMTMTKTDPVPKIDAVSPSPEPQAEADVKAGPEPKAAEEDVAVAVVEKTAMTMTKTDPVPKMAAVSPSPEPQAGADVKAGPEPKAAEEDVAVAGVEKTAMTMTKTDPAPKIDAVSPNPEPQAEADVKAGPEPKAAEEDVAVAVVEKTAMTMTKTDPAPKIDAVSPSPEPQAEADVKSDSEAEPKNVIEAKADDKANVMPEKEPMAETVVGNSDMQVKPEMPIAKSVSKSLSEPKVQLDAALAPAPATAEDAPKTTMEEPLEAAAEPSKEAVSASGETKPETTAEIKVAAVQTKGFRLQLGSFRAIDGAETLRDRLLKEHKELLQDIDLVVETVTVPGRGDFFRLHSRPVPDREMVDETCLRLAIQDVPCLLVQVP